MDYELDTRTEEEKEFDKKHPLISLNSGAQKDFVKLLFYRRAYKKGKEKLYNLRTSLKRKDLKIKDQAIYINNVNKKLKELKKELNYLTKNNE